MQYPQYREQGWPIGSGMVESANKVVVEARLKGAGMHWERQHVNPMLTLRNAVCNERWSEVWQESVLERCNQRQVSRQQRATERWQQFVSSLMLFLLQLRPPTSKPALPPCLVPLVRLLIIPGNELLPAVPSWLQKNDAHPREIA